MSRVFCVKSVSFTFINQVCTARVFPVRIYYSQLVLSSVQFIDIGYGQT